MQHELGKKERTQVLMQRIMQNYLMIAILNQIKGLYKNCYANAEIFPA
jgi:hypothetical protein